MDIRNWPLDQIMQLPDCCFGRRWPVAEARRLATATEGFVISKDGLPERCVVWGLWVSNTSRSVGQSLVHFRLGDALPANTAEFLQLQALFGTIGAEGVARSLIYSCAMSAPHALYFRQPVVTMGQRLVMHMINDSADTVDIQAGIIVSSIPTEVPDWLCSGRV